MEQHIRLLAVLFLVLGALGVLSALLVLTVLGGAAGIVGMAVHDEEAWFVSPLLGVLAISVFFLLLVLSIPDIIAGIGLLNGRSWARILGIVLAALHLLSIPLGTVVGAYGLWVLLSRDSDPFFSSGT